MSGGSPTAIDGVPHTILQSGQVSGWSNIMQERGREREGGRERGKENTYSIPQGVLTKHSGSAV